jgi:hypothetical protein
MKLYYKAIAILVMNMVAFGLLSPYLVSVDNDIAVTLGFALLLLIVIPIDIKFGLHIKKLIADKKRV